MNEMDKTENPPAAPLSEKPEHKPGQPPALDADEGLTPGRRLRDLDAEIENELAAVMAGHSEKELYGEPGKQKKAAPGPTDKPGRLKGKVISIHAPDVFIDVPGGRSQGVLSLAQFPEGRPEIGTEVEISIEGYDNANGLLLLSRRGAAMEVDWSSVTTGMTVEARVTETNKGGLAVEVNGIRGFMPISQIDLYRVENAEQFVNQRLLCMVTEVNPEERNLVVSRRALLEKEREEKRDKLWQELAEGQVREGVVRSVRDFGAFVDLGGADGLLHVSEMSWGRVKDASEVVQPGQTVKVVVLKVDREHRKIGLGLRQLMPSPWDTIQDRFPANSIVTGKVTRTMDFGAFVELEPGVEGLIHISELAPQRVFRVTDIVKPEQEVQVKVLRIDTTQRKMSLSLKAAQAKEEKAPESEPEEEAAPASKKPPRPRTTPLRGGIGT
jgi:small subunit ribosomal protein S1